MNLYLPLHTRKVYVNTIILPLLEYGCIVWTGQGNATLMLSLQVVMNNAAKIFLDRPINSSSSDALNILGWSTLESRRTAQRCIYMFKSINNLIDNNIAYYCGSDVHHYNTRRKNSLRSFISRTSEGLLRNKLIDDWNRLPAGIQSITNLTVFKRSLKDVI